MWRCRIPQLPTFFLALACVGVLPGVALTTATPAAAATPEQGDAVKAALRREVRGANKRFYESRDYKPLWIAEDKIGPSARMLVNYLQNADLDGLKPSSYRVPRLQNAIEEADGGDPVALARAEAALSDAFSRYVREQRKAGDAGMTFVDKSLRPAPPAPEMVLRAAAAAKSLREYIKSMGWMSPQYVRLRELAARASMAGAAPEAMARLRLNMDRARVLPSAWARHVVVDSSSGRLWYYEDGKEVGTMRVVVGTAETPTPMLAGYLQWAILNPYWNVPASLVRTNIAPKVLSGRSLDSMRIEALSDWTEAPSKIPASKIDWAAVAAGNADVRLRELPGPANSMGKVKLLFPNDEGIYLHDTPSRDLLKANDRHFSNGCIRLEKADELTQWLLGKHYRKPGKEPEQAVHLPVPVPVYLTYLTAAATDEGLAFRPDVYGLDS